MWLRHTMEFYSAIKSNETVIHAETWMNVEHMLSEISRTQKDRYCVNTFI